MLATGYRPVLGAVRHLLDTDRAGVPRLTEDDESTRTEDLFLAGPAVRHEGLILCFAHKDRGRFPVVAEAICAGLERDPAPALEVWRAAGMWIDDLAGCARDCAC